MQGQGTGLRPGEGLGDFMAFTADAQRQRRSVAGWTAASETDESEAPRDELAAPVWWPLIGDGGPSRR